MPVMPKNAADLFAMLRSAMEATPDKAKMIGVVIGFKIAGHGDYVFDPDVQGKPMLAFWSAGKPIPACEEAMARAKCRVEVSETDLASLIASPQNGMTLYFSGKIKIHGEPMAATKLQQFFALLQ